MALTNVLLLTNADGSSLSREDQAAVTRGLPHWFVERFRGRRQLCYLNPR